MSNQIFVHKRGETGAVLTATLSDRDGPVDLSDWTVTLNVRAKPGGAKIIDNAPCTGGADGVVTCEIGDASFADAAGLRENQYKAEFKVVRGGVKLYWPKHENNQRTYFVFEVQNALD